MGDFMDMGYAHSRTDSKSPHVLAERVDSGSDLPEMDSAAVDMSCGLGITRSVSLLVTKVKGSLGRL